MGTKMSQPTFQLKRPERRTTSVIFASPHSGRVYPDAFLNRIELDRREVRTSEDAFVDELFSPALDLGAPLLASDAPRAFVDLNRAPDQFFEQLCADLGLAHDPARVRKARENAAQTKKMAPITLPRDILAPLRERYLWRIANWKFLPDRIAQNWMGEIEAYDIG